jgi:DNA-binding CsgD family transcriptional regulator/PAS domain-containing protein
MIGRRPSILRSIPRKNTGALLRFDDQVLLRILEVLYEAPTNPSQWRTFLQMTGEALGGEAGSLLIHDFSDVQSVIVEQWNVHPDAIRQYEAHYTEKDVWFQRIRNSRDWLATSEQLVRFHELQRTEFYTDLIRRYDIPHAVAAMLARTQEGIANMAIYRGHRAGAFADDALEPIRVLRPHIQRAYRLHTKLTAARRANESLQAALDCMRTGVILVGEKLKIVTTNRAADRLLAAQDGLLATREGLRAESIAESAELQRLVSTSCLMAAHPAQGCGGGMEVTRRKKSPLRLMVSPARGLNMDRNAVVQAIVFVTDMEEKVRLLPEALQQRYGLTPAECRLAILLADGRSLKEISEMLKVSRNTLKSQLASTYSKTGSTRQSDLVRILLNFAAHSHAT